MRAPRAKRLYNSDQIDKLFQKEDLPKRVGKKVRYVRVSSDDQKEDLERQIQDLRKEQKKMFIKWFGAVRRTSSSEPEEHS
jgi:predicted site-specific integrase-resolvase